MWPRRRWSRAASALLAVLLGCYAPAVSAAQPATSPPLVAGPAETLVLAVTMNGEAGGDAVEVRRRGGTVAMAARDLRRLGLTVTGQDDVVLDTIPGLRWAIDTATQSITLRYGNPRPQRLSAGAAVEPFEPLTPSGWGAIVSYDASITKAPRADEAAALLDGSFYTPRGHAYATVLASARQHRGGEVRRLDTGFTAIDRRRMRRLTIGDTISSAAQFSRPVRLAGVQYSTDFSVRPDLVTFPLPSIAGAAAVPSTVDLIVGGSRRATGEVRAGQFAVADIPVQTGVNTITVAVRDALGRETTRTVSAYASRALLKRGLTDLAFEAGPTRLDYGSRYDRYGSVMAAGTVRRGLTDRLTVEGHGEGSARLIAGGIGATAALGTVGQIDASIAATRGGGGGGRQLSAGFERIGGRISIVARHTRTTRGWYDLAARYGAVTRSHVTILNLGFDLHRFGTANIGVVDLGRGWLRSAGFVEPALNRLYRVGSSRIVTATHSVRLFRNISALATGGADLRQRRSFFAQVGLLATLGGRTTAFAGANARSGSVGGSAEIASNAVLPGQFGYRASVAQGAVDRIAGGVEYQGASGRIGVQAERTNGQFALRAAARGAVIVSDGIFTADAAPSSVAIVDTAGQAGVRIYRDNRPAGITDRRGRLVVANLNPFTPTKISIDPDQIADDFSIGLRDIVVRPSERTGVHVRFPLHRDHPALVLLVDDGGRAIRAGSRARLRDGTTVPIGLDGALYLDRVMPTNDVVVTSPDGHDCSARFTSKADGGLLQRLGPVRCTRLRLAAQ